MINIYIGSQEFGYCVCSHVQSFPLLFWGGEGVDDSVLWLSFAQQKKMLVQKISHTVMY
jgi:hypothetical protein